jgi:ectoine hydroxylase-related dioxygenase (phytanoyl-CoA dioxygenase family)
MHDTRVGYSIHENVFTREEMADTLDRLAHATLVRTKAGARRVLLMPAVRRLATDRRLVEIAETFVVGTAVAFRATLFDKSPASNWLVTWHQDTALPLTCRLEDPQWGPWSEKAGVLHAHAPTWALDTIVALRVHLDDSTAVNGPLRVLPGTHDRGVLSDEILRTLAQTIEPVDCVAAAGGVVAMKPLTVHASSKASGGGARRVLHIEYAASVSLGAGIELAVD